MFTYKRKHLDNHVSLLLIHEIFY